MSDRSGAAGAGRRKTGPLAAFLFALALAGLAGAPARGAPESGAPVSGAAYGRWGFDESGMDPAVKPGDSFFEYANGAWLARTAIPADKSRFGMFDALNDRTLEQLRAIVTDTAQSGAAPDTETVKIGALYTAFMDEDRIERLDVAPVADDLAEIRAATTRTAIAALMGRSQRDLGRSLFNISVYDDEKDPDRHALHAGQGGLGLPDRDYYLRDAFKDKKPAYHDYVARLLDMAGWPEARERADDIVAFETRIAEASWSRTESRDRDRTYNPMALAGLDALAPDFPWSAWLGAAGIRGERTIVVRQKSAFPRLARIFAETPVATLQAWKAFHVLDEAAPYLSSRFVKERFDFRGQTLLGQAEEQPRWRRAVQLINGSLGEAVGREYVARHFPPASRARMEDLVGEVKHALRGRIETWPG